MKQQKRFIPLSSTQKPKTIDSPNKFFHIRQINTNAGNMNDSEENLDSFIMKKNIRRSMEKTSNNSPMTVKNLMKSGKFDAAMIMFENTLDNFPDDQKKEYFSETIKAFCHNAMKGLVKGDMYSCFNILFECLEMVKPEKTYKSYSPNLHILVLNNLATSYKFVGRNNKAYLHLTEAAKILYQYKVEDMAAMTNINLCSITSKMGFHKKALEYAKTALIYAQNSLLNLLSMKEYPKKLFQEKVNMVAIAFYNIGVESEFFKQYEPALHWYKKAYMFIEEKLEADDSNIRKYKDAYLILKEKLIENQINELHKPGMVKFQATSTLKKIYPSIGFKKTYYKERDPINNQGITSFYFDSNKIHINSKQDNTMKIGFSDIKVTKIPFETDEDFDIEAPINYDINKESLELKIDHANFDIDLDDEETQVKVFEEKGILEWDEFESQTPNFSRQNFLKNLNKFSNPNHKQDTILSKRNSSASKSVIFQESPQETEESKLNEQLSEVKNESPTDGGINSDNQQSKRKAKPYRSQTQTFGEKEKVSKKILKNPEQNIPPYFPPPEKIYIKVKDMEIQTEVVQIIPEPQAQPLLDDYMKNKEGVNLGANEQTEGIVTKEKVIVKIQRALKKCLNKIYFQRKTRAKMMKTAIIKLSKHFKMKIQQRRFQIAKLRLKQDYILMHSGIIRINAPEYALVNEYLCELRVSLLKSSRTLKWILINIDNKNIYKTTSNIDGILDKNIQIDSMENLKKIKEHLQTRISFLKINRYKLIFEDEKEKKKVDSFLPDENIEKVEKLQAFFKKNITLGNKKLKKKNPITYESKFLKKVSADLFILFLQYKKNDQNFSYITGKLIGEEKGQLNVLSFPNHILKYYQRITPENIFDIIEYDGGNRIKFSDDVLFKFEKIEKLKKNDNSTLIESKMIKKIQSNFRGYLVRKGYKFLKALKHIFKPIKIAYIIRNKRSYFIKFSYKQLGNLLIIKVYSFYAKRFSEISVKLFEIKENSQIVDVCEIIIEKINFEFLQGMNEFRITIPKIEELQKSISADSETDNMDPFLNLKIEQNKELSLIYIENSIKLHNTKGQIIYDHINFDVKGMIKIQRCFRTFVVRRNFKFCIDKNIVRNNVNDYLNLYSIKEQELNEHNREETDSNAEFDLNQKKNVKKKKSLYEKKKIIIMEQKHKFNKNLHTQIKMSYDIYFKSVILKIVYSKQRKEQTFTNSLESYGIKEFNKTYFKKNFNELVINHLKYDDKNTEFTYDLKKMEEKIVNKDIASKKNFVHSNDMMIMSSKEKRKNRNQQGNFKLLKTIQQKINDTYLKFDFYFDVQTNRIYYDAINFDDPFNIIRTPFILPHAAENFLKEERTNILLSKTSRIYQIMAHFIENSAFAEDKEKAFQENINFLEKIMRIQRIFRVRFAKKQIEQTKIVVNKSKSLLCRKFFKINDRYVDLMLLFCNQESYFEINVKFIEIKRENYKKFKVIHNDMPIIREEKNILDLMRFMKEILEMISIKLIRNEIFIVSSSDKIYIE